MVENNWKSAFDNESDEELLKGIKKIGNKFVYYFCMHVFEEEYLHKVITFETLEAERRFKKLGYETIDTTTEFYPNAKCLGYKAEIILYLKKCRQRNNKQTAKNCV